MKHTLNFSSVNFFVTNPLPCPYLEGRFERRLVTELNGPDNIVLHDLLSRVGFRRSHGIAYTPVCHNCNECVAVRTLAEKFTATNSQRRVLSANKDISMNLTKPTATYEQYLLFKKYQDIRHMDGDMATMDFLDYKALIEDTSVRTELIEFRLSGELVGCCLLDGMEDGLSAVYSFFDPTTNAKSLGTHIVLMTIKLANERKVPYVYLGYWIKGSPKMAYKQNFRPLEYCNGSEWLPLHHQNAK